MKKLSIVFVALVLIAIGFLMGTMSSSNKAYAILGGGAGDAGVGCISAATGEPCPVGPPTVTISRTTYDKLLEELGTYKALEIFWATEILTPAPAPCTSSCAGRHLQIM